MAHITYTHTVPKGHILTKQELEVLARILAVYSDVKIKELQLTIQQKQGGEITLEEVIKLIQESSHTSIADTLEDDMKKGKKALFINLWHGTYIYICTSCIFMIMAIPECMSY